MNSDAIKEKWNKIYGAKQILFSEDETHVAEVLREHAFLLPKSGETLDLACGLGGNAIFLAKHNLNTYAWDISQQAINKLQAYSREHNISLTAEARDVERQPPAANSFDVICVAYFLQRNLTEQIISALKPNGLLFYQTFLHENVNENGPSNPEYRLQPNELLGMFSPLHLLSYREYGRVGDTDKGLRDVAYLVAQKR